MTVESLHTVMEIIDEDRDKVLVVYRFKHAVTGLTLYSVEYSQTLGSTQNSEYVADPVIIYTKLGGWR